MEPKIIFSVPLGLPKVFALDQGPDPAPTVPVLNKLSYFVPVPIIQKKKKKMFAKKLKS